jgi:hypothetical protein
MFGRQLNRMSFVSLIALVVGSPGLVVGQQEFPGQLHTIRKPGAHQVNVNDLMQVRYKTRSASNGIATLAVELSGDSVRQVGLVTADIDPDRPAVPGAVYFVIVLLKAERPGTTTIRITPITNEENRLKTFEFTAEVQEELPAPNGPRG